MTLPVIIFTDLDDTLFQTARKLGLEQMAGAVEVTQALNGQHSFMTEQQASLLNLFETAQTVPVTARGSEAFARVELDFGGPAIVANGAVILDANGVPEPEWQARIAETLIPHRSELAAMPDLARNEAARIGAEIRTWLVEEPFCGGIYAVIKVEPGTPEVALAQLAPVLADSFSGPWRMHLNGNNLALIPPGISKATATKFLLKRLRLAGPLLTIGIGDSTSDLEFMRLCDLWMTPTGSQLDRVFVETAA